MSSRTPTVHILSQFLWPDDAPTGIYAEQLADGVAARGIPVRLIAGAGIYRRGLRSAPATAVERLDHFRGARASLVSTMIEYAAVGRTFRRYVARNVAPGDVTVVTTAPPTTVFLHSAVRQRGAVSVYWLQDYYPELVRGIWDPPSFARRPFAAFWNRHLTRWDHVVKAASNLAYSGANARVIRNWPTVEIGELAAPEPRTALYSGNLGYGHDLGSFLRLCRELKDAGYRITVRGDGPKMADLPDWVDAAAPCADPAELIAAYERAEVHLIAGHPKLPGAVFPSKIWNSLAACRRIMTSGFVGAMSDELDRATRADFRVHLPEWIDFVAALATDRVRS